MDDVGCCSKYATLGITWGSQPAPKAGFDQHLAPETNPRTAAETSVADMALLWVAHARRPLYPRELREAITISFRVTGAVERDGYAAVDIEGLLTDNQGRLTLREDGTVAFASAPQAATLVP